MNKRDDFISKLEAIEKEILELQEFYNLHAIEIKNLINHAIVLSYIKDENVKDYIAYKDSTQIYLYNIRTKENKIKNISMAKYKEVKQYFVKLVQSVSIKHNLTSSLTSLSNYNFINTTVTKRSNKYIYLKPINTTNAILNNISFKYKKDQFNDNIEYLLSKNEYWIFIETTKLLSKIKKNPSYTDLEIRIDLFHVNVARKFTQYLLNKISKKTKFKINIKCINRDTKEIYLFVKEYMPLTLIEYIKNYVYTQANYMVIFTKH